MATYFIPEFLESAFSKDFTYTNFEKQTFGFYVHNMGDLKVTDGKIIACDPYLYNGEIPFEATFPIGAFPVQLAIAKINTDERVALARINFAAEETPVTWQMAVLPGRDLSILKKGQYFGYPVDAGTGAFMDAAAGEVFGSYMDSEVIDEIAAEMEESYKHTRSWLLKELDGHTIALFSSGWGDGVYATYIGFDAKGKICRLVTDFGVIGEEE
ncbi:DUF4241 domain-containing protein [Chitinophaga sp.]|uniref:DUF4241 domain-containing protein n=1 Tax=Chitinophaga sp. TaxID=1869181 RepID=UPI0031DFFD14